MKKENLVTSFVCLITFVITSPLSMGGLTVIPSEPTTADPISIRYTTELENPGIKVSGFNQSITGYNQIQIDVYTYQESGIWIDILVPYEHVFEIGNLPAGFYSVELVRTLEMSPTGPTLYFDEWTGFEVVVPEPMTIAYLNLGAVFLYTHRKQ